MSLGFLLCAVLCWIMCRRMKFADYEFSTTTEELDRRLS